MSDALHTGQERRHEMKEVMGDTDEPLSMSDKQLGTRLTKFVGDPNRSISMCKKHAKMQYPGEDTAWLRGQKRIMSHAIYKEQGLGYVVNMDKAKSTIWRQPRTRVKTNTRYPARLRVRQEQRYVVKEVIGGIDKPLSVICEQPGIRLTEDKAKPNTSDEKGYE